MAATESDSVGARKQKITGTLAFWKDINLNELRPQLDSQGIEIGHQQERSLNARKELADLTRSFKKAPEEERQQSLGRLMRAYQDEIDQLTKRAKFAETAFMGWYKLLYEAPDPAPGLVAGMELTTRLTEIEVEHRRVSDQLQHTLAELQTLHNQDVAMRRLEERVKEYENEMEQRVVREVEKRSQDAREQFHRAEFSYREKERTLKSQLDSTENALMNARMLHERAQSQLLSLQAKQAAQAEVGRSEADLLLAELTTAKERIAALETERDTLLLKRQAQSPPTPMRDLSPMLEQKDQHIEELIEQVRRIERSAASERDRHTALVDSLQRELQEKQQTVDALREQLDATPTPEQYAELKQQLKMLKALQFNVDSDELEDSAISGHENPMVALLVQKNRRLEDELTHARVALEDRTQQLVAAQNKMTDYKEQVERQTALVSQLENDIALQRSSHVSPPPIARTELADVIPDMDMDPSEKGNFIGKHSHEPTMLDIVTGQRDRFKSKIQELEEQLRNLQQQRDTQVFELEALKQDNVNLYKKIKYLENYRRSNDEVAVDIPSDSDTEARYRQVYEQQIDPFMRFNKQEKVQRMRQLSYAERVALTGGRFFLANKMTRSFVFFYSITLHILVFITLYRLANC